MGRTASPLVSLRITMGMFVTGSIMRPRIFISTSIATPGNFGFQIEDFRWVFSQHPRPTANLKSKIYDLKSPFPCSLYHHFAQQAVGKTPGSHHGYITPQIGSGPRRYGEVQGFVLRSPANPLAPGFVLPFNHYFKNLAYMTLIPSPLDLPLLLQQNCEPAGLFAVRNRICQPEGRRIRPR